MQNYGVNSMVAPLKRVLVVAPKPFPNKVSWQEYGYFHAPDEARTQAEHTAFRAALEAQGCEVVVGESHEASLQDAIFAYDPSIMTPQGAILTRMGKPLRLAENSYHGQLYRQIGVPVLGQIQAPGTLEGGDTFWLDEHTLMVGRGYRTNAEGIRQLKALLEPQGVEVIAVDLPYFKGPKECLHLMSLINLLDYNLASVFERFMPVALMEMLEARGIQWISMPEEEFYSLGNNILTLSPRRVLMVEGNPESIRRLREAGVEVVTYSGEEICKNREGGPTCLTRPLLRVAD